ncbi:DUF5640 domain-containing protein [Parabacteroides hominis]|jgi:hypothetical protein|uniref:DUF5640 domain-containing protein n=1 Tax=Parabacteroides hominis TaxID=2763057 RepID=A0ABR7DU48_9BACT|nr:DUF5640 domain-containing protein [Parabacteroides hominis]MBC5634961.1 hypothetical protein [Parabacteroides hominis]MBD9168527.1 hypothetical protein [Parabacteroides johnsonii]
MKTKFTYLLMIVMTMAMSLAFTSCGDDDDDKVIDESTITGLWYDTTDDTVSFDFKADGTGVFTTNSGTQNFKYTYSSSEKTLKLWYVDSTKVQNFTVQRTGNTLMLTQGSSVYVLEKK